MAAVALLASCSNDDDLLEDVRGFKPTVTLNTTTAQATEGEEITFTLTVDRPLNKNMEFKLELVDEESTASFRDFTTSGEETDISGGGGYGQGKIGYALVFPAYATTYSFTVTPNRDFQVEGPEVIKLLLRSAESAKGQVAEASRYITINVSDFTSGNIGMQLVWDGNTADTFGTIHEGTYLSGGEEAALTEFDFDVYVFDGDFNQVDNNQAATGDSPEELELLTADLADGEYTIVVDLYDAGPAPDQVFDLPVKLNVIKYGTWSQQIPLTFASDHGTSAPGGLGAGVQIAGTLTKVGSTYTLANDAGEVLAQGRQSSSKNTKIMNAVAKARLHK